MNTTPIAPPPAPAHDHAEAVESAERYLAACLKLDPGSKIGQYVRQEYERALIIRRAQAGARR